MVALLLTDAFPDTILPALANRDISLWLHTSSHTLDNGTTAKLVGLPWHEVFLSSADPELIEGLRRDVNSDLLRKRGFIQIITTDLTQISLPPRSLPVYILDPSDSNESFFDKTLRRLSMLGSLRRSRIHRLLVIFDDESGIPQDLAGILDPSFYPYVTFVSSTERGRTITSDWYTENPSGPPKTLALFTPLDFVTELLARYTESYIDDTLFVRMRTAQGDTTLADLTDADDIERPILTDYDLIKERDLAYVSPEEMTEEELNAFFDGEFVSWRPYAARLPWTQESRAFPTLKNILRRLDNVGPAENRIAYIASEPGAGGTTLVRQLAWQAASEGYPTLVAKPVPFVPDALPVVGFLNRAIDVVFGHKTDKTAPEIRDSDESSTYETPWVLVFDRSHWEQKESELRRFLSELTSSGRPTVILTVIGPFIPLTFYGESAKEIAVLRHIIDSSDARKLGTHLNKFLRIFGKDRPKEEWTSFHDRHNVQYIGQRAAFWIALSFWLRADRNFQENLQDRIYRVFCTYCESSAMKNALVEIAALSSQRLPLNERLLPRSDDSWPLGLHLEDNRKNLAALGLVRLSLDGEKYWAFTHDILGRLLVNALFYDYATRASMDYEDAMDPEHFRFLILRRIAMKSEISEVANRSLAEEFAITIFKVDPDHGYAAFAGNWRDVLVTLDEMPTLVRDSSRLFRHHTAISRRRIAMLEGPSYDVHVHDRVGLLERAISDIEYAIYSIERTPGDEPDLNLLNSLANAYLNLADVKANLGASRDEVQRLRTSANEATHRAYRDNPTSPFVVETHIKNLLSIARSEVNQAIPSCLEALQVTYDALRGQGNLLRTPQLASLAQQALDILFKFSGTTSYDTEPRSAMDVLLRTWNVLGQANVEEIGESLSNLPMEIAERALTILEHPAGTGDMQVLRLRYGILSAARSFEFGRRMELLESLQATDVRLSPQLRLEYALLLYQVGRPVEGDEKFRDLRRLWSRSEHFVRVPRPLDWLREGENEDIAAVQAVVGSDQSHRPMARVREFANRMAPFRPEEFAVRSIRPGYRFRARVSFGHNGPFLRPLGAQSRRN